MSEPDNLVQYWNAPCPMDVTLEGIVSEPVNPEQL
jgi:hypothetical protein